MTPYWLLFATWTVGTFHYVRRNSTERISYFVLIALTAAFIGLRYEVGADWGNYLRMREGFDFQSLSVALTLTDPGYAFLNWMSARLGIGMWLINLVCAALFMIGLGRLALAQPNPSLAILVAVPYLVIVVAMGYTRQAAAIGIACYAIADASERRVWRLIVLIGIAALFHKSAIFVLAMMLIPVFRKNLFIGIVGFIGMAGMLSIFMASSSDRFVDVYITAGMQSEGAAIRIAMNVIAALVFFAFYKRFEFTPFQAAYWSTNAILALVSVLGLATLAASTAVDRLSLFLIPMQIVIFSRLPYALGSQRRALPSALIGVIAYSFLVQFIWLSFADKRKSWIPYSTVVAPARE